MLIFLIKLFSAILPVVVLMWLLYRKSKGASITKKQKKWGFAWGAFSVILIVICIGPLHLDETFFNVLLLSALPEEFIKMVVMLILIKKYKYKSKLDIILLCGSVGLGFACLENIAYIIPKAEWISVAIARAIVSIPDHFVYAIIMGYFISKALYFLKNGKAKFINYILAFMIPVFMHWISNYTKCDFINDTVVKDLILLFGYAIPTVLIIFAFKYINRVKENTIISDAAKNL